jgi:hypothetical protein
VGLDDAGSNVRGRLETGMGEKGCGIGWCVGGRKAQRVNICRSPMAEKMFAHQIRERGLADSVRVTSAGTTAWMVAVLMHEFWPYSLLTAMSTHTGLPGWPGPKVGCWQRRHGPAFTRRLPWEYRHAVDQQGGARIGLSDRRLAGYGRGTSTAT